MCKNGDGQIGQITVNKMKRLFIILALLTLTCVSAHSQSDTFTLILTDSSALDLVISKTTAIEIEKKYQSYFFKKPLTTKVGVLPYCSKSKIDTNKNKYITIYYIDFESLKITCIVNSVDSGKQKLRAILVQSTKPTKTSISNFTLGQTSVRQLQQLIQFEFPWHEEDWFDTYYSKKGQKHLYALKNMQSDFYFATKQNANIKSDIFLKQTVDSVIIDQDDY